MNANDDFCSTIDYTVEVMKAKGSGEWHVCQLKDRIWSGINDLWFKTKHDAARWATENGYTVVSSDSPDYLPPLSAQQKIDKAMHDSCHADTEEKRIAALAYWLEQQTFQPGMLGMAADSLRSLLARASAADSE